MINVTGTASFASEQLDLTIDPESKGIRIITLRSPLYVRGTFKTAAGWGESRAVDCPWCCCGGTGNAEYAQRQIAGNRFNLPKEANQCRTILSQMKR